MATLDRLAPPISTPVASAWTPRRAIAIATMLVLAIALFQVFQSSSFTNTGQTLQQLQARQASLSASNKELEAEISALASLDRIERTAIESLGMAPAVSREYVSVNVEAPESDLLPRPLIQPSDIEVEAEPESWWQSLLRALPVP